MNFKSAKKLYKSHLKSHTLQAKSTSTTCSSFAISSPMAKTNSVSPSPETNEVGERIWIKSSPCPDTLVGLSSTFSKLAGNLIESGVIRANALLLDASLDVTVDVGGEDWIVLLELKNLHTLSRTCLETSWANGNFMPHRPQLKVNKFN